MGRTGFERNMSGCCTLLFLKSISYIAVELMSFIRGGGGLCNPVSRLQKPTGAVQVQSCNCEVCVGYWATEGIEEIEHHLSGFQYYNLNHITGYIVSQPVTPFSC